MALVLVIPQLPPTLSETGPWLAQVRARFGSAMPVLNALGLFSIGDSPLFRVLLSLLILLLLVRSADRAVDLGTGHRGATSECDGRAWRALAEADLRTARRSLKKRGYRIKPLSDEAFQADRWPVAETMDLLAHVGPILLTLGLLVGVAWGWRVNPVQGQSGETVDLPRRGEITVPALSAAGRARLEGLRLYVEGTMPELTVSATDTAAGPLGLIQTPEAEPADQLSVRLSNEMPSAHFAIPDAALFVRLTLDPEAPAGADAPILVQVFRIRSGEQVTERVISGPEDQVVAADGVEIEVDRAGYLVLTAIHDPGYWIKIVGLLVTAVGLVGRVLWPPRRLWVRQDEDRLEAQGTPPQWLIEAPEGGRSLPENGAIAVRSVVVALAPVVAGVAGWNLAQEGVLWAGAPLQIEITVVWLLALAIWLSWRPAAPAPDEPDPTEEAE